MTTSKLQIYNDALVICGERSLASLTENREPRRLLDTIWDGGGIRACLEESQWVFAMRGAQIDYDPAFSPSFGYSRVFGKPSDWVSTSAMCEDEFFRVPLLRYMDESAYWYADLDTIYVRYVSDDPAFGGDMSLWPISFVDFVAAHFASKIIMSLTGDKDEVKTAIALREKALKNAKNSNAMASPTTFPAEGSWVRARRGQGNPRSDGGNVGGNLIG